MVQKTQDSGFSLIEEEKKRMLGAAKQKASRKEEEKEKEKLRQEISKTEEELNQVKEKNLIAEIGSYGETQRKKKESEAKVQGVVEGAAREVEKKEIEKEQKTGIKSNFQDALSFFLPTIIGGLGGALFEGTEGAIAGAESGSSLGEAFRKHQMEKAKFELDKKKEDRIGGGRYEMKDLFNEKTKQTETYRVNMETGEKELVGRRGYAPSFVKDPFTGKMINRQTGEALDPRDSSVNPRSEQTFFQKLNPNQRDQFSALRKEFASETKAIRDSASKVDGLIDKQVDLAMTNPIASAQLGAQVATIFENGRLTDEDVLRYTRRNGIPDKVADILIDLKKGVISSDKAEDIKESLIVFKEVMEENINNRAAEKAAMFSADHGLDPKTTASNFFPRVNIRKRVSKQQDKPKAQSKRKSYQEAIQNASTVDEIRAIQRQYGVIK
jgi:outer membrane lipoprotein SlyB